MNDAASLDTWTPKFQEWLEFAGPLLAKGKAQEAFAKYPWYTTTGDPYARLDKPAKEARVAIVTTGGYSIEGDQEPFAKIPNFDGKTPEIRDIPLDVDRSKLRIDHVGYDHRFAEEDINVNLPLDRLSELVDKGELGALADETPVLMGLQPNVGPLIRETIPELVSRFQAEAVDLALLVPS